MAAMTASPVAIAATIPRGRKREYSDACCNNRVMRRTLRKYLPDHEAIRSIRWLRPFQASLLHPRLWHLNRHSAAGAVAAGLFCGLIPGPLQMLGAAICALVFRFNLPLAMFVTFYTNPFTIVPLYLLAYQIGRLALQENSAFQTPPALDTGNFIAWTDALQHWMLDAARPLTAGLLILGFVLAGLGYVATRIAWRRYLVRAWRQRNALRSGSAKSRR